MSWYDLPSPSLPTSGCLQPLPPPLCSNSKAYLHNLCNCVMPTLRLTTDQYQTHSDLVPMPRATVYIPFLHLSYLPDPFSLTIAGNYSFLVYLLSPCYPPIIYSQTLAEREDSFLLISAQVKSPC